MKSRSCTELESDLLASEVIYRDLVRETLAVERRSSLGAHIKLDLQGLDSRRRIALRETNRLLFELHEALMKQIVITCVNCGRSESVEDIPKNIRDPKCKECDSSMVVKRYPGNTKST
jgi:hypothetical protein